MFLHNCYKNIDNTPQEQVPTSLHTFIYKKYIDISYRKLRVFGLTQLHRIILPTSYDADIHFIILAM